MQGQLCTVDIFLVSVKKPCWGEIIKKIYVCLFLNLYIATDSPIFHLKKC